jgi:uncharacterized protein GlcG (DUF336 family)
LKTDDARRVLEAAKAKASEIGKPVSIAILDASGSMVLFERFNDASAFTAFVAEGKAAGSAFTGLDSGRLTNIAQSVPAIGKRLAGQRFVPLQGAVPISDATGIVGAIGVSGSTGEQDEEIARAGAAAYVELS